jgi:hypothetical protein
MTTRARAQPLRNTGNTRPVVVVVICTPSAAARVGATSCCTAGVDYLPVLTAGPQNISGIATSYVHPRAVRGLRSARYRLDREVARHDDLRGLCSLSHAAGYEDAPLRHPVSDAKGQEGHPACGLREAPVPQFRPAHQGSLSAGQAPDLAFFSLFLLGLRSVSLASPSSALTPPFAPLIVTKTLVVHRERRLCLSRRADACLPILPLGKLARASVCFGFVVSLMQSIIREWSVTICTAIIPSNSSLHAVPIKAS